MDYKSTMNLIQQLPFKIGQEVEVKCFRKGYRGAWFRCKIRGFRDQKDGVRASLEYFDYPGEKLRWTKLYQMPPKDPSSNTEEMKPQLILRPCFPALCHKSQMPDASTISELVVIVEDVWKVGDLVDLLCDDCYWFGRVTHLLADDKVQVQLPDPPIGEGKSYKAFCKNLRPSLDWSPEHGWTVPISGDNEASLCCASLIHPLQEDKEGKEKYAEADLSTGFASCEIQSSILQVVQLALCCLQWVLAYSNKGDATEVLDVKIMKASHVLL